ncbi:sugar ABC transporter permease [Clostridia bacterium]|nr:sugar ABC transporter permease [Clostridia bacterium]
MEKVEEIKIKKRRKMRFNSDVPFNAVVWTLMVVIMLLWLIPLLYVFSAAFSSADAILSGDMLFIPRGWNIEGFKLIFQYDGFGRSYLNTILYCMLTLAVSMPLTLCAAYPLSRGDFMAKKFIMVVYTITLFFGGGLVPTYLLIRNLHLYNSVLALVLPGVSVWNIIIVRSYFNTRIPKELQEAANIDGCGDFAFFLRIAVPLSSPILIVIGLYALVGQWNSYFGAMIFLDDRAKYPLQLLLRELLLSSDAAAHVNSWAGINPADQLTALMAMKYGTIIISAVPLILLYAFIQKYFIRGVMVGSLKG